MFLCFVEKVLITYNFINTWPPATEHPQFVGLSNCDRIPCAIEPVLQLLYPFWNKNVAVSPFCHLPLRRGYSWIEVKFEVILKGIILRAGVSSIFLAGAIHNLKSSPTFSVRPCSSVGRVTVDLIRRSWVRFPPRSKDFFFASCGSLFPFTRANAQWVIHGFK